MSHEFILALVKTLGLQGLLCCRGYPFRIHILWRNFTWLWANLSTSFQDGPLLCISVSVSSCSAWNGPLLILFPCRFQVRHWLMMLLAHMLRVWAVQPHFSAIFEATASWVTLHHSSSWVVFSWAGAWFSENVNVELLLLLVGCRASLQCAGGSQGWTCPDSCTCCHTEIQVADWTSLYHSILTQDLPVPALML